MKRSKIISILILPLYFLGMGNVNAVRVFKCVTANGDTTFSSHTCAAGSDLVKELNITGNENVVGAGPVNPKSSEIPKSGNGSGTAGTTSTGGSSSGGGSTASTGGGGGGSAGGGGGSAGGGGGGSAGGGGGAAPSEGGQRKSAAAASDNPQDTTLESSGDTATTGGTASPVGTSLTGSDTVGATTTGSGETKPGGTTSSDTGRRTVVDTTGNPTVTTPGQSPTTTSTQPATQPGTTTGTTPPPPSTQSNPDIITIQNLPVQADTTYDVSEIQIDKIKGELLITGQNFGTGPNLVLYDPFNNGITDAKVPLDNSNVPGCATDTKTIDFKMAKLSPGPLVGCWQTWPYYDRYLPTYYADGHSGSHSMMGYDHSLHRGFSLKRFFNDQITEIYISYWVRIPPGKTFTGAYWPTPNDPAIPGQFPKDSAWKFTWLNSGGTSSSGRGDITTPTYTGQGVMQIAGNDQNIMKLNTTTWWSWQNWIRISTWIRANQQDPLAPGDVLFQAVSKDRGFYQQTKSTPIFDADGPDSRDDNPQDPGKYFNQIWIPGWMRPGSKPEATPLYDDIYLATGPGSVSRVEIGDSPTYNTSTNLELQIPIDWNDTQIRASIIGTDFAQGIINNYLYITDSNGNVNQNGYLLTP